MKKNTGILRQNFYQGQRVAPEQLNELQEYADKGANSLALDVLGYGIVQGFELSKLDDYYVEISGGSAFNQDGERLFLNVGTRIDLSTFRPTVGERTIKIGMKKAFIGSDSVLNSVGDNVDTILTPSVEFVTGESLESGVFELGEVELNSLEVVGVKQTAPELVTIPKQVKTTEDLATTVDTNNTNISNRVDSLTDTLEEELDNITTKVNTNNTDISNRVNSLTTTVDTNNTNISSRVNSLTTTVDTNNTSISNRVDSLTDTLEEELDNITTKVNTNNNNISNRVDSLTTTVDTNNTNISNRVDGLTAIVDTNNTSISSRVDNLTDTLEEELDQLMEGVDTLNSMIQKNGTETNVIGSTIKINNILLQDTIRDLVYPVGTIYTQYPNPITSDFDASKSPQSLFGGEWELRFADRGLFFRTEGGQASESRNESTGIQNSAIQHHKHYTNIGSHSHVYYRSNDSNRKGYETAGAPRNRNGGVYWTITESVHLGSPESNTQHTGNISRIETRSINMLMKIWERIS